VKFIYIVGIAVLLGILAAFWFARSEDETNAMSVPAVSDDLDASRQMGGNAETPQQQGSRQNVAPSIESTSGREVGSGSAMADPPGEGVPSASATEQAALRDATEIIPGQPAGTRSSEPSAIDKTSCEAAAKTLKESWRIFDVTPTQVVIYARNPSPPPNSRPSAFDVLKARLLAPLCSGGSAFNQDYAATMEFVAISPDSHVRILLGDHWISDGTVLSQLSESEQEFFANSFIQVRRRLGPGNGANLFREEFERQLARNPGGLIGEP
jgi:hypothetical protein